MVSGAPAYVLQLVQDTTVCAPVTHTTLVEIEKLLQQFPEVFKEPEGLPPVRDSDHEIPLKSGTVPPNTRPYRVPHMKSNELKKQVYHLLKSRVIRASQSPYVCLAILVKRRWLLEAMH